MSKENMEYEEFNDVRRRRRSRSVSSSYTSDYSTEYGMAAPRSRTPSRSPSHSPSRSPTSEHIDEDQEKTDKHVPSTAPVLAPAIEERQERALVKLGEKELKHFRTIACGSGYSRKSIKDLINSLPKVDDVVAEPPMLQRRLRPDFAIVADVGEKDLICLHDVLYASLNMVQLAKQNGLSQEDLNNFLNHAMKLHSFAIMMVTGFRRRATTRSWKVGHMHRDFSRALDGKPKESNDGERSTHYLFPNDVEDQLRDEIKEKKKSLNVYCQKIKIFISSSNFVNKIRIKNYMLLK